MYAITFKHTVDHGAHEQRVIDAAKQLARQYGERGVRASVRYLTRTNHPDLAERIASMYGYTQTN